MAWTAGSVNTDYILDLAPTLAGTKWVDQKMVVQCVIGVWVSDTAGPAAPTWGLVLPTAVVSSSSTATTSLGMVTSTGNRESSAQTSSAPATMQSKKPNSAKQVQVATGLIAYSLVLAVALL